MYCEENDCRGAIEQVFDSYGYKEIVTPSIEFYQTYQTGFEQVQEEAMYKFLTITEAS